MNHNAQQDLTREEKTQLESAQQLIRLLEKGSKAHQLYLPNNKILLQHKDRLLQAFLNYLKEHGELVLSITPDGFRLFGELLDSHSDKNQSIAFHLHNEGARRIRFLEGLTHKELDNFLVLLNTINNEDNALEGSSTMLWEWEFEHISYDIAEYIIDDPDNSMEGKIEEVLDPSMQHHMGPSKPLGPPEEIEAGMDTSVLLPTNEFIKVAREVCVLDRKEFEQIQREIAHGEKHERLMMDLFDILMTLILEEKDNIELNRLYHILLETVDSTVLHGELYITSQFLWALRGLLEGGQGDFSLRQPDRILHILTQIGTQERTSRYLTSLNIGFSGSVKDIVNFFTSLPKDSFPVLLRQIHVIASPQLRKEIAIAIAQLYDHNVNHFRQFFQKAKSPDHLLDGLLILTHTRDARLIEFMQPVLQHPNRSVRLAAINALKELAAKESRNYLLGMLEDQDSEIRLNAVRALATCGDHTVGRLFQEKIISPNLINLGLQEKRSYFYSAAKLLKDELVTSLQKILRTKKFFQRQQMDEVHQCAAYALGVIGSDASLQALRIFEKSGSKSVRQHCSRELKKISG